MKSLNSGEKFSSVKDFSAFSGSVQIKREAGHYINNHKCSHKENYEFLRDRGNLELINAVFHHFFKRFFNEKALGDIGVAEASLKIEELSQLQKKISPADNVEGKGLFRACLSEELISVKIVKETP